MQYGKCILEACFLFYQWRGYVLTGGVGLRVFLSATLVCQSVDY